MDATPSEREQDAIPNRADDPQEQEHEDKPEGQYRGPHRGKIGTSESRLNGSRNLSRETYGPEDRQKGSHHQSDGCTWKSKCSHNESPKSGNYVGCRYSRWNFDPRQPETGKKLWEAILGGNISVSTITYAVNGKQYIAVITGDNAKVPELSAEFPEIKTPRTHNAIYAFALP